MLEGVAEGFVGKLIDFIEYRRREGLREAFRLYTEIRDVPAYLLANGFGEHSHRFTKIVGGKPGTAQPLKSIATFSNRASDLLDDIIERLFRFGTFGQLISHSVK